MENTQDYIENEINEVLKLNKLIIKKREEKYNVIFLNINYLFIEINYNNAIILLIVGTINNNLDVYNTCYLLLLEVYVNNNFNLLLRVSNTLNKGKQLDSSIKSFMSCLICEYKDTSSEVNSLINQINKIIPLVDKYKRNIIQNVEPEIDGSKSVFFPSFITIFDCIKDNVSKNNFKKINSKLDEIINRKEKIYELDKFRDNQFGHINKYSKIHDIKFISYYLSPAIQSYIKDLDKLIDEIQIHFFHIKFSREQIGRPTPEQFFNYFIPSKMK